LTIIECFRGDDLFESYNQHALAFYMTALIYCRSIKVQIQSTVEYSRQLIDIDGEEVEQRTSGYFHRHPQHIEERQSIDLADICSNLTAQAENFSSKGSGFHLNCISRLAVVISKFAPLCGSSYLPTPKWLELKHCIVDVENSDEKCFVWSILADVHPVRKNPQRLSHYKPYENSLNLDQLTFPVPINQINRFERNNTDTSVNVLSVAKIPDNFYILYSTQKSESKQVAPGKLVTFRIEQP
jgi:hypothetical protein